MCVSGKKEEKNQIFIFDTIWSHLNRKKINDVKHQLSFQNKIQIAWASLELFLKLFLHHLLSGSNDHQSPFIECIEFLEYPCLDLIIVGAV